MNIAIIGATGRTGSKVMKQALARGHSVMALVRGAGRISAAERLRVVDGSATDTHAVEDAVRGAEVVVVTVNAMVNMPGLSFHCDVASTVVRAIHAASPSTRLFMQTSASHGLRGFEEHASPFIQRLMAFMIDHVIADHRAAEGVLRAERAWLHYTVFCPPQIVHAPPVGGLHVAAERLPPGNFTVTYEDLGKLIIDIAESGAHDREVLGVNGSVAVKHAKRSPVQPLRLLWENVRMKVLGLGPPSQRHSRLHPKEPR